MLTRIAVGIIFALAYLALLFFLPAVCLAAALSAVAALASYELLRAAKAAQCPYMYAVTAVAAALIPLSCWAGYGAAAVRGIALLLMAALFLPAIRFYGGGGEADYRQVMVCLFGGLLVPACLSALVLLRGMGNGRYLALLPVICANLADVGAYFIGMFLGRHRGITRVSPNKSIEGFAGGILTGCLFMVLYALALRHFAGIEASLPLMALYGLVGSIAAELGDLSFSLIKRQCGVKDYGDLLPGHGGMMDRFDSTTFAAPTLLLLVELLPAF